MFFVNQLCVTLALTLVLVLALCSPVQASNTNTASSGYVTTGSSVSSVVDVLDQRTADLIKFISLRDKGNCSTRRGTVGISLKYGREGNLWVQYMNLIWLAQHLNRWPVIPPSDKIFQQFNLNHLEATFCTVRTSARRSSGGDHLSIKAADIHGPYHLYKRFAPLLPPQNSTEALESAADEALFFFASIYAGVKASHMKQLSIFIDKHLNGSLDYVAIQKRHYRDACLPILYQQSRYSDFSPDDYDMSTPEWKLYYNFDKNIGNLSGGYHMWVVAKQVQQPMPTYHPLCNMSAEIVTGAVRAHRMTDTFTNYFIMTDNEEPMTPDLVALHPVTYKGGEAALMDRLLGAHAALFIRNSASSFSLCAEVLRRVLSLPMSSLAANATADFFFADWFSFNDVSKVLDRRKAELRALLERERLEHQESKKGGK